MSFARWLTSLATSVLVACAAPVAPVAPLGPPGAPVTAEVLGHPVHARSADEMQHLILRELTDRYAAEQGIAVTQADVDAYIARQRQVLASDPNVKAAPDDAQTRAAREQAARAYLLQRRIDASLQQRYGGRIALKPGGAVPVDAYRRFLQEQSAQGHLRILDAEYATTFWRTWTDDTRWHFVSEGSEAAARAFEVPVVPR